MAEGGEFIVNRKSTAAFFPILESINAVGNRMAANVPNMSKFAGGGFVGVQSQAAAATAQAQQQSDLSEIRAFIQNMPAPVVDVRDIVTTQKRVQVKDNLGKL